MAVLAPIERPSVASTTSVKTGLFRIWRSAKRVSFHSGIGHSGCNRSTTAWGPNCTLFLQLTRLVAGLVSGCGTRLVEVGTRKSCGRRAGSRPGHQRGVIGRTHVEAPGNTPL